MVRLTSMAEPFANALKTMKSGELLAQPVQTSYGWHVIRLDETRALAPPSFDSLRDKLAHGSRPETSKLHRRSVEGRRGAEI